MCHTRARVPAAGFKSPGMCPGQKGLKCDSESAKFLQLQREIHGTVGAVSIQLFLGSHCSLQGESGACLVLTAQEPSLTPRHKPGQVSEPSAWPGWDPHAFPCFSCGFPCFSKLSARTHLEIRALELSRPGGDGGRSGTTRVGRGAWKRAWAQGVHVEKRWNLQPGLLYSCRSLSPALLFTPPLSPPLFPLSS